MRNAFQLIIKNGIAMQVWYHIPYVSETITGQYKLAWSIQLSQKSINIQEISE